MAIYYFVAVVNTNTTAYPVGHPLTIDPSTDNGIHLSWYDIENHHYQSDCVPLGDGSYQGPLDGTSYEILLKLSGSQAQGSTIGSPIVGSLAGVWTADSTPPPDTGGGEVR